MDISQLFQQYGAQLQAFSYLLLLINALVHLVFAGAVARDAGSLYRIGRPPLLVSGPVWAFAVLIGGVMVAGLYWFIHHSNLTRSPLTNDATR